MLVSLAVFHHNRSSFIVIRNIIS